MRTRFVLPLLAILSASPMFAVDRHAAVVRDFTALLDAQCVDIRGATKAVEAAPRAAAVLAAIDRLCAGVIAKERAFAAVHGTKWLSSVRRDAETRRVERASGAAVRRVQEAFAALGAARRGALARFPADKEGLEKADKRLILANLATAGDAPASAADFDRALGKLGAVLVADVEACRAALLAAPTAAAARAALDELAEGAAQFKSDVQTMLGALWAADKPFDECLQTLGRPEMTPFLRAMPAVHAFFAALTACTARFPAHRVSLDEGYRAAARPLMGILEDVADDAPDRLRRGHDFFRAVVFLLEGAAGAFPRAANGDQAVVVAETLAGGLASLVRDWQGRLGEEAPGEATRRWLRALVTPGRAAAGLAAGQALAAYRAGAARFPETRTKLAAAWGRYEKMARLLGL